jgi:DNA-binding CsgD family transcriptional regulator
MLFAVNGLAAAKTRFDDLPLLTLRPLPEAAARRLLSRAAGPTLDAHVRERLITQSNGVPQALLEFLAALTPAQVSGTAALPLELPISSRLEEMLLQRMRTLPDAAQRLLLLVAAERSGEQGLLWRAAETLEIAPDALEAAETFLRSGTQITFRESLMRAAVYASATEAARRQAHLALAAAMDPVTEWDRAAWHNAAATGLPDEAVAAKLEASAIVAQERGGYTDAGAYLEFAARMTPDAAERARRNLEAAEAQLAAGDLEKASALLAQTTAEGLGDEQAVRARRIRATLAVARGENGHTSGLLIEVGHALEPFDPAQARATYLEALSLALFSGRLGPRDGLLAAARAARAAPQPPEAEATAADHLLAGLGLLFTEGHGAAAPTLRKAIDDIRDHGSLATTGPAFQAAFELWDDDALTALARRRVELARTTGALTALPNALSQLGTCELLVGRFDRAEAYFDEADEIARATGNLGLLGRSEIGVLALAVARGEEMRARGLAQKCSTDGTARGLGTFIGFAQYSLAQLELGRGSYRAAMTSAQAACLDDLLVTRTLPELVEAAARAGDQATAAAAAEKLAESTLASESEWGLGVLARSRALVARDPEAEELYREAIDHLQRCRAVVHLARTKLVYGEWLRRTRRRRDAREQLRAAHELLDSIGAEGFAQRAATELVATGERIRRRTPETLAALTPHEWRIAALVTRGATNAEVAAQLYISPRTVEYHLSKVFRKVGVSSRTELAHELAAGTVRQD